MISTSTAPPPNQHEEDADHDTNLTEQQLYERHLNRVLSGFKFIISAENAELLAGLLTDIDTKDSSTKDGGDDEDAHDMA